jgi:hypothetical protein
MGYMTLCYELYGIMAYGIYGYGLIGVIDY